MSNIWSSLINLAGNITGTLGLANGGTGATTKAAAFNALSPLTTAGDLLYGGASGAGTRLAAGSGSQVLLGGTTPVWQASSAAGATGGYTPGAQVGYTGGSVISSGNLSEIVPSTLPGGAFIGQPLNGCVTVSASTYVYDANTITLGAGVWEITACPALHVHAVTGQGNNTVAITQGASTILRTYSYSPVVTVTNPDAGQTVSFSVVVMPTSSTVYKIGVQCAGANSAQTIAIVADGTAPVGALTCNSYWYAKRIA